MSQLVNIFNGIHKQCYRSLDNVVDFVNVDSACQIGTDGNLTLHTPIDSYDAIIVGAGWAGLKAAETLVASGISSILLLEAKDTVGGRSKTENDLIPGVPLDLGTEWLYTDHKGGMVDVLLDQLDYLPPFMRNDWGATYSQSYVNGDLITKRVDEDELCTYNDRLWSGRTGFLEYVRNLGKGLKEGDEDESFKDALTDFKNGKDFHSKDTQILNMWMHTVIQAHFSGEEKDLSTRYL